MRRFIGAAAGLLLALLLLVPAVLAADPAMTPTPPVTQASMPV